MRSEVSAFYGTHKLVVICSVLCVIEKEICEGIDLTSLRVNHVTFYKREDGTAVARLHFMVGARAATGFSDTLTLSLRYWKGMVL